MAKLTAASVANWKATDKRQEVPDAKTPGLYLIVQPSGKRSWAVRYRSGAKHRRMSLGKFPAMSLADARSKARDVQAAAQGGDDPAGEREQAKAAKIEARLSERDKIRTLVGDYTKRHLAKLKSGNDVSAQFRRHVLPIWGDCDVHEIARRDVLALLDGIADSGRIATANRVRVYLSHFFGWCVSRDILAISPVQGVKPVGKEASRERVLTDDEIRWFWRACDDLGFPWGPMGQILLLTGQRRGEVAGMRDSEIVGGEWHLPPERTKNGRAHNVPLSRAVSDVLGAVERIKGKPSMVFTTTGETPLSGFYKGRNHIAERMAEIASDEAGAPVEIPHWTFHDLRRTAATGMARLGIPVRVTEAVLNHASGTGGGIVGTYQRYDYADEKRAALATWAEHVKNTTNRA